ncbi:hypothetical protein QR680_013033 [Steinernema hermaphroditum]|uniref:C2 domain-containing protein n=1 Tax=Steinernema hermaphroditum TaxID=289476 RepID=A0AA39I6R3_9BILA|nr:hypothetical protein QR680_013033 [Steinernema hermaphroditum]
MPVTVMPSTVLLLLLAFASSDALPLLDGPKEVPEGAFWITADLLSVEWRPRCLTTSGCANPQFKMTKSMDVVTREEVSISWPIVPEQDIVQDQSRSFVSFWTRGAAEDVNLDCQIVGTDPTYNFPRICDQTLQVRLFERAIKEQITSQLRLRRHELDASGVEKEGKMVVEVKGRCFNATLAVQKHLERCPWCPEVHHFAAVADQQQESVEEAGLLGHFVRFDELGYVLVILVLSGVSVVFIFASAYQFVTHRRLKNEGAWRRPEIRPKHHLTGSYLPGATHLQVIDPLKPLDGDDSRYETPWESKYHPMQYWMSNKSDVTVSSPLDSSSMLGSTTPTGTAIVGGAPRPYYISPNSSLGAHDDSGLESV